MCMPERRHTGQVPVWPALVAALLPEPVVGIRQTGELTDAGIDDAMPTDGFDDRIDPSVFGVALLFRETTCVSCSGELSDCVGDAANA
ncbi:MAG TPA: hypothetical protein VLS45_08590 [Methylomicrobium sp.]|nr:hypothetical protein [Methylomicrobium sp.]